MSQKLILALTVAVGLGVVGIGYYFWGSSAPVVVVETSSETPLPPTAGAEVATTPRVIVEKQPEPVMATVAEEPITSETKQLEKSTSQFIFMVYQTDVQPKTFFTLENALTALRSAGNDATLSLTFEKCAISSIDEKIFRRFLARVGDYIFVQRVLFFKNVTEVLSDPEFAPVSEEEIEVRGNILFAKIDEAHLAVEIRGLAGQVDQVEIVARDMLIKAISDPKMIIDQPQCKAADLSDRLFEHRALLLDDDGKILINAFQDAVVYDVEKFPPQVQNNLGAFLPSVEFRVLPNITVMQTQALKDRYEEFYKEFDELIVKSLNTDVPSLDDALTELIEKHHAWLVLRVQRWAQESELSLLIKNSLFFP